MQTADPSEQNLEGTKIPTVSHVLMKQKIYAQSDDIAALG